MNEPMRRADEHVREGLFHFSLGRVLDGRRAWRQALAAVDTHPVAADYLASTDDELSADERRREQEELSRPTRAVHLGSDRPEPWADDETTGEISGKWRRGTNVAYDPSLVKPPGEGGRGSAAWAAEVDAAWDASATPLEGEGELPPLDAATGRNAEPGWLADTLVGGRPNWEGGPTAPGEDEDTIIGSGSTVEGLLGRAVAAFHDGDLRNTRRFLEAVLERDPHNGAARSYVEQLDQKLRQKLEGGSIPELTVPMDEIPALTLDLVGGYVVSLIDGQTSVDDIYALSSHIDEAQVTRILANLVEAGTLRLRRP